MSAFGPESFQSPPGAGQRKILCIDEHQRISPCIHDQEEKTSPSSKQSKESVKAAMVQVVIEEIKEALTKQGHDVGDEFNDPKHWQELLGDTKALEAVMEAATKPLAEVYLEPLQRRSSIASDITGDWGMTTPGELIEEQPEGHVEVAQTPEDNIMENPQGHTLTSPRPRRSSKNKKR